MTDSANVREWRCSKCGGDGFVLDDASGDAVACECRAARVRRARSLGGSSAIPRKYRGVSFDRAPAGCRARSRDRSAARPR